MKKILLSCLLLISITTFAKNSQDIESDRKYWTDLCYRISAPILRNMSNGELQKNMNVELSPTWDGRDAKVSYMEAFGRLMVGIAPWLDLPNDDTDEGKQRKELHEWALKSYANAVDPDSPDYLKWKGESQVLVDASFIANSFIRAPKALWEPLDSLTKERYIEHFQELRTIKPAYNNWLLFRAMIEAFFISIDEKYDAFALELATRKMNEWYLGDGWYSDGEEFSLDYYNGYVIQPMLVEIIEVMRAKGIPSPISFDLALKRMQRYNHHLERLITLNATFPAVGRSLTYRMGAFQPLVLAAWKYGLHKDLTNGGVRNALTSVMKNMFEVEGNFDKDNYLQLGFVGHQPQLADYYTNNGSMYLTSTIFLVLGLPAHHSFWTDASEDWTSQKAWSGKDF